MKIKGLLLTAVLAAVATILGNAVPLIGAAVFSIILGILVRQFIRIPEDFEPGIKFSGKKILQWAIILMGFTLSFRTAVSLGLSSLPITLTTITAALLCSYIIGRWMGIPERIRTLIGVGTAICGGSAIAAASPIVEADDEEIAFSISTIFLFNIIAVFLFPALGHLLHMTSTGFGYFAGTAINDTSSVVAAGYTFSKDAGDTATIVKLVRALMIVPVCLLLVLIKVKREQKESKVSLKKIFPWFILYFFMASVFASIVPLPEELVTVIKHIATLMIAIALAGIGLSVNLKSFRAIGYQPVLLGAITWFVVTVTALIMQQLLGIW
ncbi:YeiH family protein [Macrococcus lamae]|uniref:YeiH family putative sulfate export transporter n=1 Tax=Macrococcus lamae TaxID=198484 RepID=A0A4R6BUN0_9STAP|nr:YeiH family protein [Macrococcus lamae]TDM11936.1 YeiH family putative sulfate export transporter [Macrococcus lamae]